MSTRRQRLVSIVQLVIFAILVGCGMFAVREWMQHAEKGRQNETTTAPDDAGSADRMLSPDDEFERLPAAISAGADPVEPEPDADADADP